MRKINAPKAWQTVTGSEIPVAVVDSGVMQDHDDLTDNILKVNGKVVTEMGFQVGGKDIVTYQGKNLQRESFI